MLNGTKKINLISEEQSKIVKISQFWGKNAYLGNGMCKSETYKIMGDVRLFYRFVC